MPFTGKKIVLGVSGGIAAYKSCELVRELRRRGATVRVMMTSRATEFVSPMTFAALSEQPVLASIFPPGQDAAIAHIDWARWPEVIVLCPATANLLAKLAQGFADDPVSTTVRAARVPIVLCPAMNSAMWQDPLVQRNVALLKENGYHFVDPEFGAFATTQEGEGWGRLARMEWILSEILAALQKQKPFTGKKILVTAGRTEEYLDPVRMLTNPSTGRMGFALAEAARAWGGQVTLVSGPTHLTPPYKVEFVPVVSAAEMAAAVQQHYAGTAVLAMAAAVSDYRPRLVASEKMKKRASAFQLELEPTVDILTTLAEQKSHALHIGFALETENELENARTKLQRKKLDLIVLNNPRHPGAGFAAETNKVTLIDREGRVQELELMSKLALAFRIYEYVLRLF
ncbi:MAG: bifunctional phosphopantothenoylcysteine decarboxylase/phosphopantothenate--cysteine ligase CoaBC [candidate division KSB1 bacterium]|nr:bifunctional phosphopantothenoylcysteine decarboxylase/phosphopantothenate--cysteine ligase CoaBC [candidate division KSB1 bacterium]MDZ7302239.1 bifunctional phosphopantothenoylcysteine decarboxylase/phosphopantothenate--cysteine ligase CoaBC [candidate division KSB1 bacterium]MDZ7311345.1 bifunctional phosphopantothenoylcysteine decarboxylase/phosphopantothenate--cysteine ligase CoaBC [candidate division KSB1 bacterium]